METERSIGETPGREPPSTRPRSITRDRTESRRRSRWECNYHVIFIPKRRRKTLDGALRQHLREVFHRLAGQKERWIEEGYLMPDYVHPLMAIPPKYAMSQVVSYLKGKSAIHLARGYGERKRNFVRQHFWVRRYFVSTAGHAETVIREYLRQQEEADHRLDQMNFWKR